MSGLPGGRAPCSHVQSFIDCEGVVEPPAAAMKQSLHLLVIAFKGKILEKSHIVRVVSRVSRSTMTQASNYTITILSPLPSMFSESCTVHRSCPANPTDLGPTDLGTYLSASCKRIDICQPDSMLGRFGLHR